MDTTKLSSELFKSTEYNELKSKVHNRLIEIIDLSILSSLDQAVLRVEIKKVVDRIIAENGTSVPLNLAERERLSSEIQDEVLGLGPIEPYMHDPTVNDILVNTYKRVYVERAGKLYLTETRFKDD